MEILLRILTLFGSLGIFLYGMKLMSEALQKAAGKRMRKVLAAMTATRIKGLISGLLVTATIQSSSAVTVLIVSFVNAGLLPLTAAVAVIFGANIGTTFTAWVLGLLGFTFNITKLALPMIGLGFPLILSRNRKRRVWGEFTLGLALLLLGLEYIKDVLPNFQENPEMLQFLTGLTENGFLSVLLFTLSGLILTAILQSSSATMALILAMAYKGLIDFDMAAAMVIGMNIGTTITANLAAILANQTAKRAARSHFLFNVAGAFLALLLFRPFLLLVDLIFRQSAGASLLDPGVLPSLETTQRLPLALALYHTLFNIFTAIILFPFVSKLAAVSRFLTRQGSNLQEFRLKYLYRGLMATPELSTLEARKKIGEFGKVIAVMFRLVTRQFNEMDGHKFNRLQTKITESEDRVDAIRLEILEYLTTLSANELTASGSRMVSAMQRIVESLENTGDLCYELSSIIDAKVDQKIWFSQDQRERLKLILKMVDEAIDIMNINLSSDYSEVAGNEAIEAEKRINEKRTLLQMEHMEEMKASAYRPDAGNAYADMIKITEQIGDHVVSVTRAIMDTQLKKDQSRGNA